MKLRRLFLSVLVWAASASAAAVPDSAALSQAKAALARLPLRFEANQGQWSRDVRYAARTAGGALLLTSHGAALLGAGHRVDVTLLRASRTPRIEAMEPMQARTNYFIGRPEHWRTGVENFTRVAYHSVYPGIDIIYYGSHDQLEYDFVLKPGADPASIRLRFRGADRVYRTAEGDLCVESAGARFVQKRPVIYQEIAAAVRRPVEGEYELLANGIVGLRLRSYDRSRGVVIDPVITFSTFIGGSSGDQVNAVMSDSFGFVYVGGQTTSTDAATYGNAVQPTYDTGLDGFIGMLDPNSGAWIYFTYLGGGRDDVVTAMSMDSDGNIVAAGTTTSSDFPLLEPLQSTLALSTTSTSSVFPTDAFVSIISVNGGLGYSTYYGGTGNETPRGVARDANGLIYIFGTTTSPDLPVTATAIGTTSWGTSDLFAAVINPLSATLVYGTYLGGESDEDGRGMALGPNGVIYFVASTYSQAFPTAGNAYRGVSRGLENLIVGAIDTTQSGLAGLVYCTYLGGSLLDEARSLSRDSNGKLILSGWTISPDFPVTANAMKPILAGPANAFVMRVNPAADPTSFIEYSTFLGGSVTDIAYDAISDAAGNLYVTGYTMSPDFPVTPDAAQSQYGNGIEAFLVKLNPAAAGSKALLYGTFLGGTGTHVGTTLTLAPNGSIVLAGYTQADWTLPGADDTYFGGASDGFVAVFK